MADQPLRRNWSGRERRYDWFRLYNDFLGHPKFRYVARQCAMSICEVSMIAVALLRTANRSRPRGWVRDFSVIDCGAALDIEPEKVGEVYRKLEDLGWIDNDYLATWDERQPDREDPTGATAAEAPREAQGRAGREGRARSAVRRARRATILAHDGRQGDRDASPRDHGYGREGHC